MLRDIGECRGDASSADWVRFEFRDFNDYEVSGSVGGQPVSVPVLGDICTATSCELSVEATIDRPVVIRTKTPSDSGAVADVVDGYWLEPPGFGVDAFCAGPGSTVRYDQGHVVVELLGLRTFSCADSGVAVTGELHGAM